MHRISASCLAAATVGCLACAGGGAGPGTGDVVVRFIEDTPGIIRPAAELQTEFTVFEWRWDGADDPVPRPHAGCHVDAGRRGGLLVRSEGGQPVIDLDTDLDTGSVDRIEIDVVGARQAPLELAWRTRDAALGAELPVVGPVAPVRTEDGAHFVVPLADRPDWRGRLDRLRLMFSADAGPRFRIVAVRGIGDRPAGGSIPDAASGVHTVDLGHDARGALVAVPGVPHRRTFVVPGRARLELACGLPEGTESTARFEVRGSIEGGEPEPLFELEVGPGTNAQEGVWHDAVVDLADLEGRTVTIELLVESDGAFATDAELPAWASPEIIAPTDRARRPNVVLICLDTLRAGALSSYGSPLPTSPGIDAWAADRAVRFANTVAGAPWTLPSHASLFTGLDAVRHGVNFNSAAPPELDMLAEQLRRHGYTTAAVTGGAYLRPKWGFSQGFDRFAYWADEDNAKELAWVTDRTLDFLDHNRDRTFFLFVHTYEIHYPHRRREPYFSRFARMTGVDPSDATVQMRKHGWQGLLNPGDYFVVRHPGDHDWSTTVTDNDLATIRLMYSSAVAYADSKVGAILDRLAELGIDDRTMVIVTSDHGEALGEDGRAGHSYLEDYNSLVPLIVQLPGGEHGGRVVDRQVRLIDVAPTVLDATGAGVPPGLDGRSLLPLAANPASDHPTDAFTYAGSSNRGLALRVDNSVKYIFPDAAWAELADRERLIDLRRDPEERHDIAAGDPRLDALRARTAHAIDEEHNGYRLVIANAGPDPLGGRLSGSWVQHDRIKVAQHGCRCVHWQPGAAASFELAQGQRVELLFAEIPSPEVGVVARTAGGPATDIALDLDELELPIALTPDGAGWRLTEGVDEPPATGFWLHVVGEPSTTTAPPPTDADAIEQLRALGYIE